MKKIVALLMALVMVFALCACGQKAAPAQEAEPTFRLAGAGVENYEKTIAGTEAKLSMLGNKLTQQQRAGRHVFMTESRWHSSVDECQRRKFSAKKPEDMLKLGREPVLACQNIF